jgi:hypothetical protein
MKTTILVGILFRGTFLLSLNADLSLSLFLLFVARVFLLLTEAIQKETMPEENKSRCVIM